MKAINYVVTKHGRDYVQTTLVPANHSETPQVSPWGLAIAGGLLLVTVVFMAAIVVAMLK